LASFTIKDRGISFNDKVSKLEKDQRVSFYGISKLIKNFRKCSQKCHSNAPESSKEYPAYLRYNGRFYESVWGQRGIEVWMRVANDNWKVLILSTFYGFLSITDPIGNYDLRLSNLNNKCRKLLPEILELIIYK